MAQDLVFWQWATNEEAGDPRAVYDAIVAKTASPAIKPFDARALEAILHRRLSLLDDPSNPLGHSITSAADLTWVRVSAAEHRAAEVRPVAQRFAGQLKLVLYDPKTRDLVPPSLPKRHCLKLQGAESIYDPTVAQVRAAIASLRVNGPSLMILTDSRGNAVQAAGGQKRLTVDYTRVTPAGESTFSVGWADARQGGSSGPDAEVEFTCASGVIRCRASEVLTPTAVAKIAGHFYEFGSLPDEFKLNAIK